MPELWVGDLLRNSRLCCSRPALRATAHCLLVAAAVVVAAAAANCGLDLRVVRPLHGGKGGSTARKGIH